MFWIRILLTFFISIIGIQNTYGEGLLPFTDIKTTDTYYSSVLQLYKQGILTDTDEHLFYPNELIARDLFVWIVVWVSCHKCISPSIEDYIKYQVNPFIDVTKINPYFYCISYWKEKGIIQWYNYDINWSVSCQNNTTFTKNENPTSTPFCPVNNITRIEAAAVLLRQASLWNEAMNSSLQSQLSFPNNTGDKGMRYWFWYTKKAIQVWLIDNTYQNIVSDNIITEDELNTLISLTSTQITRWEFAVMAAKMLSLNQCSNTSRDSNDFWVQILIFDKESSDSKNGNGNQPKLWTTEDTFDLYGKIFSTQEDGPKESNLIYKWNFLHPNSQTEINKTGKWLDNFQFPNDWTWVITLTTTDKSSGKESVSVAQVSIEKSTTILPLLSSFIWANEKPAWVATLFFSKVSWWVQPYSYLWDFGDGWQSTEANPNHVYLKSWIYPVTLTVRDAAGNISVNKIVVNITENCDPDKDTVLSCKPSEWVNIRNTPAADIIILEKEWVNCNGEKPSKYTDNTYDFLAKTSTTGNYSYNWVFVNQNTWEKVYKEGKCINDLTLNPGTWTVTLTVTDKDTDESTTVSTQLHIPWETTENPSVNTLTVWIDANPISWIGTLTSTFTPYVSWGSWGYTYKWDFGDGTTSTEIKPTHTYDTVGSYTVTLIVTDSTGHTATSSVVVRVLPVDTTDLCPEIAWPVDNQWCPIIETGDHYTDIITEIGETNKCMMNAMNGENLLIWQAVCVQCPCKYTLDFNAVFRVCDIIFPTILSTDKLNTFARGTLYQVPKYTNQ